MNDNIISKIKGRVADSAHIDFVKTPIDLSFEDGKIIMDGVVDSISVKRRAVNSATGVFPDIIDRVKVKAASHMGDAEIIRHIEDAFDEDYSISGITVDVSVTKDSVVHLEGTVHSLMQKRLAEVFAWWVPGSVDVINNIKVEPREKDSDDEIKDTVRLVFERDKLVKDSSIVVNVKDSVVTLSGHVKSEAARDAAEDDVWYIKDVREVVNNLRYK